VIDEIALRRLGYDDDDLRRARDRAERPIETVADVRRVIDRYGYLDEWRIDYRVRSVRASLRSDRVTCIDAAILAYGLLEWITGVRRAVLAIHRRDPAGEECGHCVALYWGPDGRVGAISKSSFAGLGHRDPVYADEEAVAASYARGYLAMGFTPLYFGVTTLEEVAGEIDWRFAEGDVNAISSRIQERYTHAFSTELPRAKDPLPAPEEAPRAPRAPPPVRDVAELLARMRGASAEERARPALTFYRGRALAGRMSRGELVLAADRVAAHLAADHGVRRGDAIAVLSPNALDVPALMLGLLRLGATIVPLNPLAPPQDWAYILGHSGARGLVASAELIDAARAARPDLPFVLSLGDVAAAAGGAAPEDAGDLSDALAVVLYTSGTTGDPKGVGLRHANILANARSMAQNFRLDRTTQLAVLPLYHAHAFGFGLMTSLLSGGHLVLAERFDPFAFADVIRREGVEVTSVVPTLLPPLREVRLHRAKVPTLRCVMVSSAPLDPAVAWGFEEQTGLPLVQGWGLSEYTNFACCLSPDDAPDRHRHLLFGREYPSVGPALAPTEVTVRDDRGEEAAEGARGELWVRGPSRMEGYFRDDDATRAALRDGWLRTGDEGFFAEDGGQRVFFVTGRIKEIICRGAEKLSPLAIERRLTGAVPEVSGRLVVVGFPHVVHGEEVGAYLEEAALGDDLRARLTEAVHAVPPDQRPKVLLHGAAPIPRTHTGKVQRRRLAALFAPYDDCRGALRVEAIGQAGASSTTR
jgi:long-chain acyl-CoA synthetase